MGVRNGKTQQWSQYKDGQEREYYPSYREEIIEEALRKIACNRLNGVYLDDRAGV